MEKDNLTEAYVALNLYVPLSINGVFADVTLTHDAMGIASQILLNSALKSIWIVLFLFS